MHKRTLGILPPSDVDELLDVADFLGLEEHDGTCQLGMAASRARAAVRTIWLSLVLPVGAVALRLLALSFPFGWLRSRSHNCTVFGDCRASARLHKTGAYYARTVTTRQQR